LLEWVIDRAEERMRRRKEKEINRKSATRKLRLPGKLADCSANAKGGTELFIVEGDSAGGSAKQARNRVTQAILPLRGKILNVANAGRDKLAANQQLADLIQAFDLIREGKLYLAIPPLYKITQGGKTLYARDDAHREELMKTEFTGNKKVEIGRFKGLGEMMPAQLKETTMDPKKRTMLRVEIPEMDENGCLD